MSLCLERSGSDGGQWWLIMAGDGAWREISVPRSAGAVLWRSWRRRDDEATRRRDDEATRRTTPTTGSTVEGTEMCDDGWLPSPWTLPLMTTPPRPRGKGPAQPWPGWPPPRVTTSAGDLRIPCSLSSSPGPFSTWTLQESVRRLAQRAPGTGTTSPSAVVAASRRHTAPSSTGSSAVALVTTDLSPGRVCRRQRREKMPSVALAR